MGKSIQNHAVRGPFSTFRPAVTATGQRRVASRLSTAAMVDGWIVCLITELAGFRLCRFLG